MHPSRAQKIRNFYWARCILERLLYLEPHCKKIVISGDIIFTELLETIEIIMDVRNKGTAEENTEYENDFVEKNGVVLCACNMHVHVTILLRALVLTSKNFQMFSVVGNALLLLVIIFVLIVSCN